MRDIIIIMMCVITTVLFGISCISYFIRPDYVLGSVNLIACIFWVWITYTNIKDLCEKGD